MEKTFRKNFQVSVCPPEGKKLAILEDAGSGVRAFGILRSWKGTHNELTNPPVLLLGAENGQVRVQSFSTRQSLS